MGMKQDDAQFAVLHAQAKATKRGDVNVDNDGLRVYFLSPPDVKTLQKLGVTTIKVAGVTVEFVGDKLIERVAKAKKHKWDTLSINKRVRIVHKAGLPGKRGAAAWEDLTRDEVDAILNRNKSAPPKRKEMQDKPVGDTTTSNKTKKKKRPVKNDFLMWVGTRFYPTYHDFVKEAKRLGCSKRIGHVLQDIIPGKTRIFLAHDEGLVGDGFIFGYFTVNRIEVVLPKDAEVPENCTVISEEDARAEPERECGWRLPGGFYLMSESDIDTLQSTAKKLNIKKSDVKGGFMLMYPLRSVKGMKHFRGALAINGENVFNYPETTAPSNQYPAPKHEPKWTAKQERILLKLVKIRGPKPRARIFKEFSLKTGHSKTKVAYRYAKLTDRTKEAE